MPSQSQRTHRGFNTIAAQLMSEDPGKYVIHARTPTVSFPPGFGRYSQDVSENAEAAADAVSSSVETRAANGE